MIQSSARYKHFNAQALKEAIDSGSSGGRIVVYSGTRPANCGPLTVANVELIRFVLTNPCGSVNDSILSIMAPDVAVVQTSGDASFLRVTDSFDNVILDIDAADANMNISMVAGKQVGFTYIRIDTGA